MRAIGRSVFTAGLFLLASACGPQQSAPVPSGATHAAQIASALSDDWTTMGRNFARTGFQSQNVGLSERNVAKLRLRWKTSTGEKTYTGPLVYAGNVVIVSLGEPSGNATVYDFAATNGQLLWKFPLRGEVRAAPTIDPERNLVFVSSRNQGLVHGAFMVVPGNLYAIDLVTGKLAWEQKIPKPSTGAAAGASHGPIAIANGTVFIGTSGSDPPQCSNGGVSAYDESTGKHLWTWHVNSETIPGGGGSVWGAIAFDGAHLIFGTGNACQTPVTTSNGAVALDLHGNVRWSFVAVKDSKIDEDTGGGVTLAGGLAVFINKNGTLYALDPENGREAWSTPLGAPAGQGGFATAASDGSIIVIGAGSFPASADLAARAPSVFSSGHMLPDQNVAGWYSYLKALDMRGDVLWSKSTHSRMLGEAAIVSGMVFAGLDKGFSALDERTGKLLWRYTGESFFHPSPAIVRSGVYVADDSGNVYAFSI